jgi:hypothetical protein
MSLVIGALDGVLSFGCLGQATYDSRWNFSHHLYNYFSRANPESASRNDYFTSLCVGQRHITAL